MATFSVTEKVGTATEILFQSLKLKFSHD